MTAGTRSWTPLPAVRIRGGAGQAAVARAPGATAGWPAAVIGGYCWRRVSHPTVNHPTVGQPARPTERLVRPSEGMTTAATAICITIRPVMAAVVVAALRGSASDATTATTAMVVQASRA